MLSHSSLDALISYTPEEMADQNRAHELSEVSKEVDINIDEGHHDQQKHTPSRHIENVVRVRRLFSTTQLFMFSLTNMGLWEGMCTYVS